MPRKLTLHESCNGYHKKKRRAVLNRQDNVCLRQNVWARHDAGPQIQLNSWWAKQVLNLRPPACKAGALPLSYSPLYLLL